MSTTNGPKNPGSETKENQKAHQTLGIMHNDMFSLVFELHLL